MFYKDTKYRPLLQAERKNTPLFQANVINLQLDLKLLHVT